MKQEEIGAKYVLVKKKPLYRTNLFKVTFGLMTTVVFLSVFYYPIREAGYSDIDAKLVSLVFSGIIALILVNIRKILRKRKR